MNTTIRIIISIIASSCNTNFQLVFNHSLYDIPRYSSPTIINADVGAIIRVNPCKDCDMIASEFVASFRR